MHSILKSVSTGRAEAVREALSESPAEVDATDEYYGRTALMNAVIDNHADIVLMLLEAGADPNIHDKGGNTALHFAT